MVRRGGWVGVLSVVEGLGSMTGWVRGRRRAVRELERGWRLVFSVEVKTYTLAGRTGSGLCASPRCRRASGARGGGFPGELGCAVGLSAAAVGAGGGAREEGHRGPRGRW